MKLCLAALVASSLAVGVAGAPWLTGLAEVSERYVPGSTGVYPQNTEAGYNYQYQAQQTATNNNNEKVAANAPRQVRLRYGNAVVIDNVSEHL